MLNSAAVRRQNRVENKAALIGYSVTVRMGQLAEETVRSQQPQLAADGGRTATLLNFGGGFSGIQQLLEISIA